MPNETKYVDNVNGSNGNTGNSEAQAYADLPYALSVITGGGNIIYLQTPSAYAITTAIDVNKPGDLTNGPNVIEGYTTTPGARDGRAVMTCSTNSVAFFSMNNCDYFQFRHLQITHSAGTRGIGFTGGVTVCNNVVIDDCLIDGCSTGISDGYGLPYFQVVGTTIQNSTQDGFFADDGTSIYNFDGCNFITNGRDGIRVAYAVGVHLDLDRCVFRGNTGRGVYQTTTTPMIRLEIVNCTFRGNGSSGVEDAATDPVNMLVHRDNVYTTNGAYGFSQACTAAESRSTVAVNRYNAYGSGGQANTSGARNVLAAGTGDLTTMATDPYTSSTDSTPNATAGGGAVLRGAGTNGATIGAIQPPDSGGGSSGTPAYAFIG